MVEHVDGCFGAVVEVSVDAPTGSEVNSNFDVNWSGNWSRPCESNGSACRVKPGLVGGTAINRFSTALPYVVYGWGHGKGDGETHLLGFLTTSLAFEYST